MALPIMAAGERASAGVEILTEEHGVLLKRVRVPRKQEIPSALECGRNPPETPNSCALKRKI